MRDHMKLAKPTPILTLGLHNWQVWSPHNHWVAEETVARWTEEDLPVPRMAPGCRRCGLERDMHILWYSHGHGAEILCEVCWNELATPEARRPYYRALWVQWEMIAAYEGCDYGQHSHGRDPFWRGHYLPAWEEIDQALLSV